MDVKVFANSNSNFVTVQPNVQFTCFLAFFWNNYFKPV